MGPLGPAPFHPGQWWHGAHLASGVSEFLGVIQVFSEGLKSSVAFEVRTVDDDSRVGHQVFYLFSEAASSSWPCPA
ncbi:hypothetical protein P7K49_033488, partial [Saguinus oedipus]